MTEHEALVELKAAAWQFKQMIFAAQAPNGELLATWLERSTANIRAAVPELQFKPSHERLVAAVALADAALSRRRAHALDAMARDIDESRDLNDPFNHKRDSNA